MTINKPVNKLRDWRGTAIVEGSTIIYPGRQSSSMWMVEATVIAIVTTEHWGVQQIGIRVQPIRQGTFGRTNMKPVNLTALERVTVIKECTKETRTLVEDVAERILNV